MRTLRRVLRRAAQHEQQLNAAQQPNITHTPDHVVLAAPSPPAKEKKAFTDKQLKFIDAYVLDPKKNATQCAIAAGYGTGKVASNQASRLLAHVRVGLEIRRRLNALQAPAIEAYEINEKNTMREVGAIAFSDIGMFMDDEGNLISPKSVPQPYRAAVKKYSDEYIRDGRNDNVRVRRRTIEFWPKMEALNALMLKLGILENGAPASSGLDALASILEAISNSNRAERARLVNGEVIEGEESKNG